jgi:predicted outer membrane repeat protein
MTLTGNLFYGNTASSRNPVVYRFNAALTSGGYNVVDVAYGTGNNQAGWTANANDKSVTDLLITSASFRLFHGSGAAGIIGELPAGYPDNDFYGTRITAPASAGAVQDTASENGYILATTVNNSDRGSVSVTPPPDADGLYSGTVSVTAVPAEGYGFSYWLVDGDNAGDSNPLELTVTDHTSVQAVFAAIIVNKYTDVSGSAETQGTFRYALAKAQSGETIRLSNVTPGQTVIKLTGRLPTIYRDITIEGNGVTLTRDAAWTTEDNNSQLMWISGTVTIRGIHFKDGRASTNGAAIRIDDGGDLTLESCIFSGNQTSSLLAYGGAIYTRGNLNVKGCTFCENDSVYQGGAIYAPFDVTITLTGNLFYGNTAERSLILYHSSFFGATVISTYNVVDVIYGLGDGNAGWTAGTGDSTFTELGISGNPLNTATFAPVPGLGSVIPAPPEGFPATDFYGNQRTFPGAPGAVR